MRGFAAPVLPSAKRAKERGFWTVFVKARIPTRAEIVDRNGNTVRRSIEQAEAFAASPAYARAAREIIAKLRAAGL